MSIAITYGTFSFNSDEPEITTSEQFTFSENGDRERRQVKISISGRVQGTNPNIGAESIRSAFLADDQDLTVKKDGTTVSHLTYTAGSCLRGPKVNSFSFPESTGPEMAVGGIRSYAIEVELEQEMASPSRGDVVEWKESTTWQDGSIGNWQVLETIEGKAEVWKTGDFKAYRVTQSGEALGRTKYPDPPSPLFPSKLIDKQPIERSSPEYTIIAADGSVRHARMYRIRWGYEFADSTNSLMKIEKSVPGEWTPK